MPASLGVAARAKTIYDELRFFAQSVLAGDGGLRRGVLSLGVWLSAHSPVHRSSPVDRGIAIRTRFFCESLLPPPTGPAELAERLLESRQMRDCFAQQMFRFIEGRTETPDDACELAPIQERFAAEHQTISELEVEIEIAVRPGALARRAGK